MSIKFETSSGEFDGGTNGGTSVKNLLKVSVNYCSIKT